MTLNPLAQDLNATLSREAPAVLDLLSDLGKRYYFPKGILSQSAEAKVKAKRFNATIGIATENGQPMHLPCIQKLVPALSPAEVFPYAPPAGRPELREAWREKQLRENPAMRGKTLSAPVVTCALTHGLSLMGELFINPGDVILLPDQLWGNYRLTYEVRHGGKVETFPFFAGESMNLAGFAAAVERLTADRQKLIVLLNFPNNPSGYTPTEAEARSIRDTLAGAAAKGKRLLVICDDAYFNLVYDPRCMQESIFGHLAGVHENLLAVRLDGATKEQFVWGFRVGFITFAAAGAGNLQAAHEALEKKTMGAIRAGVSNAPQLSQSLVLRAIKDPAFGSEQAAKREVLRTRAQRAREIASSAKYRAAWEPYPFNSGYFMCLKLKTVDAEPLRLHLLDRYQLGTISTAKRDLRIAFSCLEVDQIEPVYDDIHRGILDLGGKSG